MNGNCEEKKKIDLNTNWNVISTSSFLSCETFSKPLDPLASSQIANKRMKTILFIFAAWDKSAERREREIEREKSKDANIMRATFDSF